MSLTSILRNPDSVIGAAIRRHMDGTRAANWIDACNATLTDPCTTSNTAIH